MSDVNERFDRIDQALNGVNEQLGALSGRITGLDEDMSGRIARLDEHLSGRLDGLDERLEQVVKSIEPIKERLDEVATGIEPLKDLRDFVQRVADDHEHRITELESGRSPYRASVARSTRPSACLANRPASRGCTGACSGHGQPPNWVRR